MKLYVQKDPFGFRGMTQHDQEILESMKNGTYQCELKRPRNVKFHRKFFSMLLVGFNAQDDLKTLESFRSRVLILADHCAEEVVEINQILVNDNPVIEEILKALDYRQNEVVINAVTKKPKSMSFANMDDSEFERLYSRVVDVLIQNYCPGSTPDEIDEMALKYLEYV